MIRNVIFDFGNVLIRLHPETLTGFLQTDRLAPVESELRHLAERYETGGLETEAFLDRLGSYLPGMPRETLIRTWNSIIGDMPEERLLFLEGLRDSGKYRMFMLSNTNALHMACAELQMGSLRFARLRSCFEGFYLSHEMGMRKPDPGIFRAVLHRHGLVARETLFIDDTLEHTLGARTAGIHTWHLEVPGQEVQDLNQRIAHVGSDL